MKFGVLVTSHPDPNTEPYPHHDVHARTTAEIIEADRLGYDVAWIAEHHFSNKYGILPDPFIYLGYLASKTERIGLGSAVITLPLHNPVRVAENAAFVDILSGGRFMLGLGSGYRPYEFEGPGHSVRRASGYPGRGHSADPRRLSQAQGSITRANIFAAKSPATTKSFRSAYKSRIRRSIWPRAPSAPLRSPPATGFGLMLSTLPAFEKLAEQTRFYREMMKEAPAPWNTNPAFGQVDIARWVYVAETDAKAREESADGIIRQPKGLHGQGHGGVFGPGFGEGSGRGARL